MIYLDTSVALAQLLAEDRKPPDSLWQQAMISSRLLEYEMWRRINALGLPRSHGDSARALLERTALVELSPLVLGRVLEPFPGRVRTLDALHLSTIEFLRSRRLELALATYDERLAEVAASIGIPLEPLDV